MYKHKLWKNKQESLVEVENEDGVGGTFYYILPYIV